LYCLYTHWSPTRRSSDLVAGAVLGVVLGYGGTALIDALAPKLTATVGASNAASVTGAGRILGAGATQALTGAGHSVSVTLTAPVDRKSTRLNSSHQIISY